MTTLTALILSLAFAAPQTPGFTRFIDFNEDGELDAFQGHPDGRLAVSLGLGDLEFQELDQELPAAFVTDLVVADLNGDSHLDLYIATPRANVALIGDGQGRFTEDTFELGLQDAGRAQGVLARDLDSDGIVDILLFNEDQDVLFWGLDGGFERDRRTPDASKSNDRRLSELDGALSQLWSVERELETLNQVRPHSACGLTLEHRKVLELLSVVTVSNGFGRRNRTLRVSGANLQVVNGVGSTNTINGLGNLIIGYNELGNPTGDDRTGSHNIVGGRRNSYRAVGGQVLGVANSLEADFATVSGGALNTVTGNYASIAGGRSNTASGTASSVGGGIQNLASGSDSAVSGGRSGEASGFYSSISGGLSNTATKRGASVSGGQQNVAMGYYSSVSGGRLNSASGSRASISGGAYGHAQGGWASISGGMLNSTIEYGSTVSGGRANLAIGYWSAVSGGENNQAYGISSSISGGATNTAQAGFASVSGGSRNWANGDYASISGGKFNTASGSSASVSGGYARLALGPFDWVGGTLFEDL